MSGGKARAVGEIRSVLRLPDWQERLVEFKLELMRATKRGECGFSWDPTLPNRWNCLTFSSACVEREVGIDLYAELAGAEAYTDPSSAFKALLKWKAKNLEELLGQFFVGVGVPYARHGDIVLVPGTIDTAHQGPQPQASQQSGVSDPAPISRDRLRGLDLASAIAEPPYFWTISSQGGLARGNIADAVKAFSVGWGL